MNYIPGMNQVKAVGQSMIKVVGRVTTSTSGTISTSDIRGGACTIAKTAAKTGRYTITMVAGSDYAITDLVFLKLDAIVVGPDDSALTTTKGVNAVVRDIDIGEGADDGTVELQFVQTNAGNADTEVQDAAIFIFELTLGNKKVG